MDKYALILDDTLPREALLSLARHAEERGYWGVFISEESGYDAQVTLGAVAMVTDRIMIGPGICSVYTRSAPIYAMAFNALNAVSQGRAVIGLGTAPPYYVTRYHDTLFDQPISRIRDYAHIIREILTAQRPVEYSGAAVSCRGFRSSVPIHIAHPLLYVAAIGPQMLAVAGEVADSVMLPPLVCPEYLSYVKERIAVGADRAGRDIDDIEISATVITSVNESRTVALEAARSMAAYFAVVYYFAPIIDIGGFREVGEEIRAINKESGWLAARDRIPDDFVGAFTVAGTPEQCRERLALLRESGLDLPILNPPAPRGIYGQGMTVPVDALQHRRDVVRMLP